MKNRKKSKTMIVVLFILYVCLSAGGLILFKLGSGDMRVNVTSTIFSIRFSWQMLLGIVCYGCSFLLWLYIVSQMNLSLAMPLSVGLVNLLVLLGSSFFLKEQITVFQWAGVMAIVIGLALINIGGKV